MPVIREEFESYLNRNLESNNHVKDWDFDGAFDGHEAWLSGDEVIDMAVDSINETNEINRNQLTPDQLFYCQTALMKFIQKLGEKAWGDLTESDND